jgi:hypothetical protein
MTTAERKARERERKRAAGLVPVEVWVPKGREDDIRDAAKVMCGEAEVAGIERIVP